MTPAQHKRFYLPAWNRCAKANDWRMENCRLAAEQPPHDLYCPEMTQVWEQARRLAQAEHRGITPRDLRYACHVIKVGRPKETLKLTNRETNDVVSLFNLLENPISIAARSRCDNPDIARRQGLIAAIKENSPHAYVAQISLDQFGTRDWESISTEDLQNLVRTVKERDPRRTGWKRVDRSHTVKSYGSASPQFPRLEYVKKQTVEEPF